MQLTPHQKEAFQALQRFILDDQQRIFVLKGYAGTGKTTLIGQLAPWLESRNLRPVFLATTGRAAKVLQNKTGYRASTIHSAIYLFKRINDGRKEEDPEVEWTQETGQLSLDFGLRSNIALPPNLVYIVDEASMIAHEPSRTSNHTAQFGSGRLLDDFLQFCAGRKIIFVGDPCQLPPVSTNPFSAALSETFLRQRYGQPLSGFELRQVIRQKQDNEILQLAGWFRESVIQENYLKWPQIKLPSGKNAHLYPDERSLIAAYLQKLRRGATKEAIMIGQANNQVHQLNSDIRSHLFNNQELQSGEMLMVVQNSYAVNLVNGDQVVVLSVKPHRRRVYNMEFLEVKVRSLHDDKTYETLLIKDLLYDKNPSLGTDEAKLLLMDFDKRIRQEELSRKSQEYKMRMMNDPYLNALRAKFGYAVTAHRAQGGEWQHVFLHLFKSIYSLPKPELYRWYYTALTRAQEHLHFNDGFWVQGYFKGMARQI